MRSPACPCMGKYIPPCFLRKQSRGARKSYKVIAEGDFLLDRQVDRILDKVSKGGMKSLSRKEKKILELKSKGSAR